MITLLAAAVVALTALFLVGWRFRARAARRMRNALDMFAEQEIARTRKMLHRRGHP